MTRNCTACLALVLILLTGCDVTSGDEPRAPAGVPPLDQDVALVSDSCAKYVLVGIWGQSNAKRGDRGEETSALGGRLSLNMLDRAVYEQNGATNVMRWDIQEPSGRGSFTWMTREDLDGTIAERDSNSALGDPYSIFDADFTGGSNESPLTAYTDLANQIYRQTGSCVIFSSEARGGSGLQADSRDAPYKVWDPGVAGSRFGPALRELREAYRFFRSQPKFDRDHVLIYWNQGFADMTEAANQVIAFENGEGPAPTVTINGWERTFEALAVKSRAAFPPGVLKMMVSLSARPQACPDNVYSDSLRAAQTAVTETLDFVSLISEVMPAPSTGAHYADCIHLSWSQYRFCENPSIAQGASALLLGQPLPKPLDSCSLPPNVLPYPVPSSCRPSAELATFCERFGR